MINEKLVSDLQSQITENKDDITKIKNDNVYSTSEFKTNKKWINGKDIYQTTITNITGSGTKFTDVSNLNIDTLVDFNAINLRDNGSGRQDSEHPYYNGSSDYFRCFYRSDEKAILTNIAGSFSSFTTTVTLLYTKTTD